MPVPGLNRDLVSWGNQRRENETPDQTPGNKVGGECIAMRGPDHIN